ncbi:MAG: MFS transporter [Candidatus Pseudobacter hemicellulosilyticus]|uniref:MFS transporter n=1 Tax=Candidatus Pseudobacter hemicellulosilyticus TaxID=3121375 RepID=A0AAJ6BG22_9BACT|nr:MAG: MFS transporter [Pseudobacter sp.]
MHSSSAIAINIPDKRVVVHKRIAVIVLFFANGFLYGNWTARLPSIKAFYGIGNGTLGTLLFTIALGALVAMPIAGWIAHKFSNERLTLITGLLFCCSVPLMPLSDNLWVARCLFFSIGMFSGAMDVSMNGQAVLVERAWKKPIMSSFHALFSIGMAAGAGVAALFSRFSISLPLHLVLVALAALTGLLVCSRLVLLQLPAAGSDPSPAAAHFRMPALAILPLGIIGFCGMTGEGAIADWSAIFMHTVVGSTESFSALAFGIFGAAMTIGRLGGDYLTHALGKKTLLIADVLLAIAGLSMVLLIANSWASITGFFLVGIGLATVVPIIYSTAGNIKGLTPSAGIAMVSTIGYMGFFLGPPMIGYIADQWGLRIGLAYVIGLFVLMGILILFTPSQQKK